MKTHTFPSIDIADLFGADPQARALVDTRIQTAARNEGMMVITGLPPWALQGAQQRRRMLALFTLPESEIRRLWRWNFDPSRPNVYRGWFPLQENALAVNFGKVLEMWTGGLIRATRHRVLGTGRERYSVPFFYEARPDAVIAPLPLAGVQPFIPFYFGDHLWDVTCRFVEQKGIAHLRTPRGQPVLTN